TPPPPRTKLTGAPRDPPLFVFPPPRQSDNIRTMRMALVVVLVTIVFRCSVTFAASREAPWKEVDDAIYKGLAKTGMEKLEPIIQGALKDKAWGEATKAIARKIV